MREVTHEPTEHDKETQKALDKLLGGDYKRYVVVDREEKEKDSAIGTYRLYGNVSDDEGVMVHLLNFIDGFLDNDSFAYFASLVSRRAIERIMGDGGGVIPVGKPKPKAN